MTLEGFQVVDVKPWEAASMSKAVQCASPDRRCAASFRHQGQPGRYDLGVQYFDQNDGVSRFKLFVAGQLVDEWAADDTLPTRGVNSHSSTRRRIRAWRCAPGRRNSHRGSWGRRRERGPGLRGGPRSPQVNPPRCPAGRLSGWPRSADLKLDGVLERGLRVVIHARILKGAHNGENGDQERAWYHRTHWRKGGSKSPVVHPWQWAVGGGRKAPPCQRACEAGR